MRQNGILLDGIDYVHGLVATLVIVVVIGMIKGLYM